MTYIAAIIARALYTKAMTTDQYFTMMSGIEAKFPYSSEDLASRYVNLSIPLNFKNSIFMQNGKLEVHVRTLLHAIE